jgi:hypothetical protein
MTTIFSKGLKHTSKKKPSYRLIFLNAKYTKKVTGDQHTMNLVSVCANLP